jgi:hypothetical protein
VSLAAGDAKECTITNTFRQPTLKVTKVVVNDGGGTKQVADFPLAIDGSGVTSGEVNPSTVGSHTVSETTDPTYTAVIGGACAADGTVSLAAGDAKECTITNTFKRPKLTVTKVVINLNGGGLTIANFPLFVDGISVTSGVQNLSSVGSHTVTETGNAAYTATFSGACNSSGVVVLAAGDEKTCTITNDDIPPQLTLNKVVINDNNRTNVESDWTLKADGALTDLEGPGTDGPADVVSGLDFVAGIYTLSETGPGGYAASAWSCTGGGTQVGNQITLGIGQSATCTITNNDLPYTLVTSSSLCTFDRDPDTPQDDFRLLLTPDHQAPGFKLNASNPGQFYYNAFYSGTPGTSYTLTLKIPYPFVTQGANPVHVYDGATLTPTSGEQCITPANGVPITSVVGAPFVRSDYGGGTHDLSDFSLVHDVVVTFVMPATGTAYVNIHLDYGLKGTSGYGRNGDDAVPNGVTTPVLIPDNQAYQFQVSDGVNTWDPAVYSQNEFKKNPGVGGNTTSFKTNSAGETILLEPLQGGLPVDVYQGTKKLGSTVTDPDGWYMWTYKYTGKATTFTVKLKQPNGIWVSKSVTMKSNGFVVVNFDYKLP